MTFMNKDGVTYTNPPPASVAAVQMKGGMNMCKKENCERHEFDYGFCLPHLKEEWTKDGTLTVEEPKRKSRKKKVDAVEVETNDETTEMETRTEDE